MDPFRQSFEIEARGRKFFFALKEFVSTTHAKKNEKFVLLSINSLALKESSYFPNFQLNEGKLTPDNKTAHGISPKDPILAPKSWRSHPSKSQIRV